MEEERQSSSARTPPARADNLQGNSRELGARRPISTNRQRPSSDSPPGRTRTAAEVEEEHLRRVASDSAMGHLRESEAQRARTHGKLSDDEYNAYVAAGKVITILMRKRGQGECIVETSSVYGAAIVMPQIARSAGWSKMLTYLACRSMILLAINIGVQFMLLYLISEEEVLMDGFAGQMYLCDFGATLDKCPGGSGCTGPGGTEYTAARLYGWDQWSTRRFVKDSLKQLFPDRVNDIEAQVDPGEYGLESYWCRWLCCFLFMMSVMADLYGTIDVLYLNWSVPTQFEYWLKYEVPDWAQTKEYAKAVRGWSELDLVKVKVAGMPMFWKVFNLAFIALPKFALWILTARAGTTFLMETSSIEDLIVNSIALTFILSIDELICENFTTAATRTLLDKLEGFPLYDTTEEEKLTDMENWAKVEEDQRFCTWRIHDLASLLPMKLICTVVLTVHFVYDYYRNHCIAGPDSTFISHIMYPPKSINYGYLNFILPRFFPLPKGDTPFWAPNGPN